MVRESRVLRLFDGSPGLFAAFHALHRLPTPRHPPCALLELDHADPRLPPSRSPVPVIPQINLGKTFDHRRFAGRSPRRGDADASRRVTKDATRTLFIELSKSQNPVARASVLVTRNRQSAFAAFVSDRVGRGVASPVGVASPRGGKIRASSEAVNAVEAGFREKFRPRPPAHRRPLGRCRGVHRGAVRLSLPRSRRRCRGSGRETGAGAVSLPTRVHVADLRPPDRTSETASPRGGTAPRIDPSSGITARPPAAGRRDRRRSGDEGDRTPDLLLAKQALSRLSYVPGT